MSAIRDRLTEAQLAMMLLTRLPAGRMAAAPSIGAATWAFPVVGAVVGGISALIMVSALWAGVPAPLAAGLALLTGVLTTGGLHEDGLADCADGFGGGRDRTRKLEIMRDSRIGSYGTLALILSLGLRWQGLTLLAGLDCLAAMALIALAASSRAGLPLALHWLPAARSDGMGKSATDTSLTRAVAAVAISVLALILLVGFHTAILVLLAQTLVQAAFARLALRQIGGQTGDVLGAMQQLAEIAGWVVMASVLAG